MSKLPFMLTILAVFAWCSTSYAQVPERCLVYKGTIKASKSIFNAADANNLLSQTIQGYWAVKIVNYGSREGRVTDSNSVIYDSRHKYYKVIPGGVYADPCDPCRIVLLHFEKADANGEFWFDAVGKGKLIKYSNDINTPKDFACVSMKGGGLVDNYAFFNPTYALKGPLIVSLTLDSKWTRYANAKYGQDNLIQDTVINEIVAGLTRKGGWTRFYETDFDIPVPP